MRNGWRPKKKLNCGLRRGKRDVPLVIFPEAEEYRSTGAVQCAALDLVTGQICTYHHPEAIAVIFSPPLLPSFLRAPGATGLVKATGPYPVASPPRGIRFSIHPFTLTPGKVEIRQRAC